MPVSPQQTVGVVVPVYRNADTLPDLHARLARALDEAGRAFEVVYVDDACPDGSGETLRALASRDDRVKLVGLSENIGQHRAILAGLASVTGDPVVIIDADLQDPPEAVPELLARLDGGCDVAFGGRRGRYHGSSVRWVTSRVFKRIQRWLTGLPVDAGTFVALTREVSGRVLAMPPGPQTVVAMIGFAGRRITSVPVERASRPVGRSSFTFRRRLSLAFGTIVWAARMRFSGRSR